MSGPRYLDTAATRAAIDRVARETRPITLIVGAGVSMEAGLPSWNGLVTGMLERVIRTRLPRALHDEWIAEVRAEGPLAAAAIAEAFYKQERRFQSMLRRVLYDGRGASDFHPQALAEQIAWFKQGEIDDLTLVTTNYDGLLEAALERLGVASHAYITGRREPAGSAGVYHVHGRLMSGYSRTGTIVLSEADYAHVQAPSMWQEKLMTKLLGTTLCVFVGVSLRDANLIRWLYRYDGSAGTPRHLALFVRQSQPELHPRVRARLEQANHERWRRRGVEVLDLDFFGEVAQFVHEVALRRRGGSGVDFDSRAAARHAIGEATFVPGPPADFAETQQAASAFCDELVAVVADRLVAEGVHDPDERLGAGVWGVNHAEGTVTLWAASDRAFTTPDALIHNELEYFSPLVAVQAVTHGAVLEEDLPPGTSRWRLVRGIPVAMAEAGGRQRSIVAALTITSALGAEDSALPRLSSSGWEELRADLEGLVAGLFR